MLRIRIHLLYCLISTLDSCARESVICHSDWGVIGEFVVRTRMGSNLAQLGRFSSDAVYPFVTYNEGSSGLLLLAQITTNNGLIFRDLE